MLLSALVVVNFFFLPFLQSDPEYTDITPSIFEALVGAKGSANYKLYQNYLAIGAVAFILLSVLKYFGAKFFSDEQGLLKAKAEIMDAVAVSFLLLGLYTFLQIVEYVAALAYPMYFENGPVDMLDNYIAPTIYRAMTDAAKAGQKHAFEAGKVLQAGRLGISVFAYPLTGDASFSQIKKTNELLLRAQLETSMAIGLSIAYAAVNYIKDAAGYFLIVGLIARIFPVFRGAGAFLISLGIGFYYIYPLVTAMFLFGIPQLSFNDSSYKNIDQSFCKMHATGALILPEQDISSGFSINLGNPQTVEEDFGLIISTEFLLSQLVALSLTVMFINNFTILLGKGLYVGTNMAAALNRLI